MHDVNILLNKFKTMYFVCSRLPEVECRDVSLEKANCTTYIMYEASTNLPHKTKWQPVVQW